MKEKHPSAFTGFLGRFLVFIGFLFCCSAISGLLGETKEYAASNSNNLFPLIFATVLCVVIAIASFRKGFFLIRERKQYKKLLTEEFEFEREIQAIEREEAHKKRLEEALQQRKKTKITEDSYSPFQASATISEIDGMEGHQFEAYCASLLSSNGFENVSITPGSGDQGVDVLAEKDGIRYAIQCKNYATKLSNTPVQEVSTGKLFYNCHVAVVMTNSTLTPSAMELAKATNVLVWDRPVLEKMITKAHNQ